MVWLLASTAAWAEAPNEEMLKALRPFHGMVGKWKGQGSSMKSSGWQDDDEVTWGFRDKDGRVSINFYFKGNLLFKEGLLTYDPASKKYVFLARLAKGGAPLRFVGEQDGKQMLKLDRDKEAGDGMDWLELKLLRGGDKLMLSLMEKKGRTSGEQYAQIELFREGLPLENFQTGPHCLITGGAGRVQAEFEGEVYYVACPNTRALFLSDPKKFLEAAKGK